MVEQRLGGLWCHEILCPEICNRSIKLRPVPGLWVSVPQPPWQVCSSLRPTEHFLQEANGGANQGAAQAKGNLYPWNVAGILRVRTSPWGHQEPQKLVASGLFLRSRNQDGISRAPEPSLWWGPKASLSLPGAFVGQTNSGHHLVCQDPVRHAK